MVNIELKKYVEEKILPEYEKNEDAHGVEHVQYVIARSFELVKENSLNLDEDMVYIIAAYHDIGDHIDRENHEKVSAEMMRNDLHLKQFFDDAQLQVIKEAIEDHRASSKEEPRSIYGKIVSSADRNSSIEQCFKRSYFYGKEHTPNASEEELFERAYEVMKKKFGKEGYAKFFFKDAKYEKFLLDIRALLEDKEKYIACQKAYIEKIKMEKKDESN